jgi:hypothetical protein
VKGLLENIPWIEYDEERKGKRIKIWKHVFISSAAYSLLECLNALRTQKIRYDDIDFRHEETLKWFGAEDRLKMDEVRFFQLLVLAREARQCKECDGQVHRRGPAKKLKNKQR